VSASSFVIAQFGNSGEPEPPPWTHTLKEKSQNWTPGGIRNLTAETNCLAFTFVFMQFDGLNKSKPSPHSHTPENKLQIGGLGSQQGNLPIT
jgi:hypothetical protein